MKNDNENYIYEFGCGRIAIHQFKNGKWCCDTNTHRCPTMRGHSSEILKGKPSLTKGKKRKHKPHIFEKILTNELCDYGCGKVAKYKFENGKICCSVRFNSCSSVRNKNRESNIGIDRNTKENVEASRLRMLNGLSDYMNSIPRDPEKVRIKSEKQRQRMLNDGHAKYVASVNMDERVKKHRKTREDRGDWTKLTEITERDLYHRLVVMFTYISSNKKFSAEELKTRGVRADKNHIDHIFSEQEGFIRGILPRIISCEGNLRLITCFENSGKGSRCDMSLEQLFKIYEEEIKENKDD